MKKNIEKSSTGISSIDVFFWVVLSCFLVLSSNIWSTQIAALGHHQLVDLGSQHYGWEHWLKNRGEASGDTKSSGKCKRNIMKYMAFYVDLV